MNELDMLKVQINAKESLCKNTLISRLEALKTQLNIAIENLKSDESYMPSKSGIIQSEACVIDTLSAELNTLRDLKKSL